MRDWEEIGRDSTFASRSASSSEILVSARKIHLVRDTTECDLVEYDSIRYATIRHDTKR